MIIKYLLFILLCFGITLSAQAAACPEEYFLTRRDLIQTIRRKEVLRDVTELEKPDVTELEKPSEFEEITKSISLNLKTKFSFEDRKLAQETVYWLIRTRHHYMGMPDLVSHFCPDWKQEHLQFLGAVDSLVSQSFMNDDFRIEWKTSLEPIALIDPRDASADPKGSREVLEKRKKEKAKCTQDILTKLEKDLRAFNSAFALTQENIGTLLTNHKNLFEDALHLTEIFAPRLTLRTLKTYLDQNPSAPAKFLGWDFSGVPEHAQDLDSFAQEENLAVRSRAHLTEEGTIKVEYYFLPNTAGPIEFSLTKKLEYRPIERFLHQEALPEKNPKYIDLMKKWQHKSTSLVTAAFIDRMNSLRQEACDLSKAFQNPSKRRSIFKKMADQSHIGAQCDYAHMLLKGLGGPKDLQEARTYCKKAADQNLKEAQHIYAFMLERGEGGPEDLSGARAYFKKAADQNHDGAQCDYAHMLLKGLGGPKDLQEARTYYKKAADQNLKEAQYQYGTFLFSGIGGPTDLPGARTYYKKAADQNLKEAQHIYACMLARGEGGLKDLSGARTYYKKAADQNHTLAQYNYALMLAGGEGGPPDLEKARPYFKKAADQGHEESQRLYHFLY